MTDPRADEVKADYRPSLAERMRLRPRAAAFGQLLALVLLAVAVLACGVGAGVLAVWLVVT